MSGVRQLQVANNLIFGGLDSGYFGRIGQDSHFVDRYFELNTVKKTYIEFRSADDLRRRATDEGIELKLKPFAAVFNQFRYTWFDYIAGFLLLGIPAAGFLTLVRWVWSIRRAGAGAELA